MTLKALAEGEKSGYDLMKFIEGKVGEKPSPGSMYPLLDKLQSEELVASEIKGRRTLYKLTAEGKKRLKIIDEKRAEILDSFIDGMKMIEALTGEDMSVQKAMVAQVRSGEVPFREVNPEWGQFHELCFVMWKKGALKKNAPKVKAIVKRAAQELRKI